MSSPDALITLPVRGDINRVLRSSLDACGLPWLPLYDMSDLPRARSYLLTQAVESGAERIVCLDADIVASAEELLRLASHERVGEHGAVTGLYALRDGSAWACHAPDERVEPDGSRRAVYAGLGFACISRASLLRARERLPELRDVTVGSWWPYCVPTLREAGGGFPEYCADDVSLWRRLAESGTQLWADTRLVAGHVAAVTLRSPC